MKNNQQKKIPIETAHLFKLLDKKLIRLLQSLSAEEWNKPTIAKKWTVKDIAAHLLDGNFKALSISRDGYYGVQADINSYADLLNFLNKLNHSWTEAAKRLSPPLLIDLLQSSGKKFCEHMQDLKPFNNAVFAVAWAGDDISPNWFHVAREYTEKFIHQQQIRDAVGAKPLFSKKLYYPFIHTFMQALPYTFRNVEAQEGSAVAVVVPGKAGGRWNVVKAKEAWHLSKKPLKHPDASVTIPQDIAWKLFSKGINAGEALNKVEISGDAALGKTVLEMVSVMA